MRDHLEDKRAFDRDAIVYRRLGKARHDFRGLAKELLLKTRAKNITDRVSSPHTTMTLAVLDVDHPKCWLLCSYCGGRNGNGITCEGCSGCGYKLNRMEIPKSQQSTNT